MAAMSHLILRFVNRGLLNGVIDMLPGSLENGCHQLEQKLMVITNGYWAEHYDFGSKARIRSPTLLGEARAADIAVNVLPPFAFAWSKEKSALAKKAVDLYHHHPRLAANAIECHMSRQLSLSRSQVNSARRQQGLLHLYHNLCTEGRCDCCPLHG
jgi:hypothetical protein